MRLGQKKKKKKPHKCCWKANQAADTGTRPSILTSLVYGLDGIKSFISSVVSGRRAHMSRYLACRITCPAMSKLFSFTARGKERRRIHNYTVPAAGPWIPRCTPIAKSLLFAPFFPRYRVPVSIIPNLSQFVSPRGTLETSNKLLPVVVWRYIWKAEKESINEWASNRAASNIRRLYLTAKGPITEPGPRREVHMLLFFFFVVNFFFSLSPWFLHAVCDCVFFIFFHPKVKRTWDFGWGK